MRNVFIPTLFSVAVVAVSVLPSHTQPAGTVLMASWGIHPGPAASSAPKGLDHGRSAKHAPVRNPGLSQYRNAGMIAIFLTGFLLVWKLGWIHRRLSEEDHPALRPDSRNVPVPLN